MWKDIVDLVYATIATRSLANNFIYLV